MGAIMRPTEFSADMIRCAAAQADRRLAVRGPWRRWAQAPGAPRFESSRAWRLAPATRIAAVTTPSTNGSSSTNADCGSFDGVRFLQRRHPDRHGRVVRQPGAGRTFQRGVGQPAACRRPGRPAQLVGDGRLSRHKLAGVPVLRGRPRAPGAATARAPPAAGHARTRASPARRRPDAGGTARRYRVVRQFARRTGQRRLFAGAGVTQVRVGRRPAHRRLLGIDPATVSTGRRQLVERDVDLDRVRRVGGGRPPAEKKTPKVIARLEALMAHETAGDPVRGLKWTRRTTAKIAAELRTLGIDVCARTVARLLKTDGVSLRVNHKKLAGASHPNRDDQFQRSRRYASAAPSRTPR